MKWKINIPWGAIIFFSVIIFLLLLYYGVYGVLQVHHHYMCQTQCNESYAGKTTLWRDMGSSHQYKCNTKNLRVNSNDVCTDDDGWISWCRTYTCNDR